MFSSLCTSLPPALLPVVPSCCMRLAFYTFLAHTSCCDFSGVHSFCSPFLFAELSSRCAHRSFTGGVRLPAFCLLWSFFAVTSHLSLSTFLSVHLLSYIVSLFSSHWRCHTPADSPVGLPFPHTYFLTFGGRCHTAHMHVYVYFLFLCTHML